MIVKVKKYRALRKLLFSEKNTTVFSLLVLSFFLIQARFIENAWYLILVVFMILIIRNFLRNKQGRNTAANDHEDTGYGPGQNNLHDFFENRLHSDHTWNNQDHSVPDITPDHDNRDYSSDHNNISSWDSDNSGPSDTTVSNDSDTTSTGD